MELILTQARTLLRAPSGSLALYDEATGELRITMVQNCADGTLGRLLEPGEGMSGMAFHECKTVLVNDYGSWSRASQQGRESGVRTGVCVPLRMGDRKLGALAVLTYDTEKTFSEDDAWLLELLGDQASMALERARLIEQAERRAARLMALHRVSAAISAQRDINITLKLVLSQAAGILERRGGTIHLWDESRQRLILAQQHGLPDGVLNHSLKPGEGTAGQVWLQGKPLVVDDYRVWEHATPRGRAAGYKAVASVPLVVAGRPLGVLSLASQDRGARFSEEEVQFMELFAGQAAIAIENGRMFDAITRSRAMEQLDRLKSEFISAVSHELRTPLTYIHGYSELLMGRDFEPDMFKEALGEIYGAAVRMTRLVDDLLDLSRFEAGRLPLVMHDLDLADLLHSAVAAAQVQSSESRIQLRVAPLPTIRADPDRMRQVVDNLLNNAQRYAPTGTIKLRACSRRDEVRVEVIDQGPGISEEDQARVFEPFYRGAKSEVLPLRGGGLGLTIVRRLVEAHGGKVGLVSAPDHGSTFWFTVPVRRAKEQARPRRPVAVAL
jgi:signal transduction histidine kinase